jgi:hypothetical protein
MYNCTTTLGGLGSMSEEAFPLGEPNVTPFGDQCLRGLLWYSTLIACSSAKCRRASGKLLSVHCPDFAFQMWKPKLASAPRSTLISEICEFTRKKSQKYVHLLSSNC